MAKKNRKKAAVLKKLQKKRHLARLEKRRALLNRNFGYTPPEPPPEPPKRLPVYLNDLFPKHTPVEQVWLDATAVDRPEGRVHFRQFHL
jgi:hypothetical protein